MKQIKKIINDKILLSCFLLSIVFILLHYWEYIDSSKNIQCLCRLISFSLLPLFLLFRYKGLCVWSTLYAYLLIYLGNFSDYTAFFIIALECVFLTHPFRILIVSLYIANIFVRFNILYDDTHHLLIHLLNCAILLFAVNYSIKTHKFKKSLILMPDETIILEHLANGVRQSEIVEFAPNTVCKKLKEARERNNIKNTNDLILSYMNSVNRDEFNKHKE